MAIVTKATLQNVNADRFKRALRVVRLFRQLKLEKSLNAAEQVYEDVENDWLESWQRKMNNPQ
jgi:hypothetical protein